MGRYFLTGAIGIALFVLAGIGVVYWASSESEPPTATAGAPGAGASPGRPGALPGAAEAEAAPAPGGPTSAAASGGAGPGRAALPKVPAAPTPDRRTKLRAFRQELMAGVAELRERVAACQLGNASLLLSLLAEEGAVRVIDVEVQAQGTASDAAIDCAKGALKGQVFEASGAEPGRSWQLPFSARGPP